MPFQTSTRPSIEPKDCLEEIQDRITNEYEDARTGAQHLEWLKRIVLEIEKCPSAAESLRNKERNFKKLVEEACPIAYFGTQNGFEAVLITLQSGNQPFDAKMKTSEGPEFIEVVNAIDGHVHALSMKMLNQNGMSFGTTNKSHKELQEILDSGETYIGDTVNLDIELEKKTKLLIEQIAKKVDKPYSGTYHLVAAVKLDNGSDGIESVLDSVRSQFVSQRKFKTITLFEARDAQCWNLFPT